MPHTQFTTTFNFWDKLWFLYFAGGCALFIATLLFGKTVNGARNWLDIGGFAFQPSELTKILFVMFLACYFSRSSWTKPFMGVEPKWIAFLGTYLFIGFLVLQRDWGTILVLFSIYIFMIYVYEENYKFLMLNIGSAAVVAVLGYSFCTIFRCVSAPGSNRGRIYPIRATR